MNFNLVSPVIVQLHLEMQRPEHAELLLEANLQPDEGLITGLNKIAAVLNIGLDGKYRIEYIAEQLLRRLQDKREGKTTLYLPFGEHLAEEVINLPPTVLPKQE